MNPFRLATLVAALSLAFATDVSLAAGVATTPAAGAPSVVSSGLDKSGMDAAVRPQDDLFKAMNGTWVKNTAIPSDKSSAGSFVMLDDLSNERVKSIIESLAATPQPAGTVDAKIGDYYSSYLNTDAIDQAGLAPLAPLMAKIDAVKSKKDLVVLMGEWQSVVDAPLDLGVATDFKDPTIYSPVANQGGLGLPNRDYYLKADPRYAKARAAYADYVTRLLTLDGDKGAAKDTAAVIELEKKIALVQWSKEQNREAEKLYNPMTLKQLAAKAPGLDWHAFVDAGRMPVPDFISISQPSYTVALAKLIQAEPLATWKAYMRVRLLDATATELPADFRAAQFAFKGTALQGLTQQKPRWELAVGAANNAMGEAIGQVYVAQYFPPAAKARMVELVDNLLKTYATSIDSLTWMTPATKAAAHEKLSKYGVKIGYPDVWRDYGALRIVAGDPIGNDIRASQFEYLRGAVRVGKKVDRTEWGMTPQTVNAYYDPSMNEIVFPAAILQPPFFDMKADDAANYGAIGAVIGHEISHGFDDQGRKFDGDGKLRDWWTPADAKAFDDITAKLVAQYNAYEPLPGAHVNGQQTLGENIADLSGLQIAYKAYKLSLNGQPAPVIDGLTGDQRFYLGFAQAWRSKTRDEDALRRLTIDEHSPAAFRADGAAINSDGFHAAFGTKPGDAMYKAPADRIRLW